MIIEITPQARDYLSRKEDSRSLTIKMALCGGWAGFSYKPAVTAGEPANKSEYERYDQDDWRVYVPQTFQAEKLVIFYRPGFFGGLSVNAS